MPKFKKRDLRGDHEGYSITREFIFTDSTDYNSWPRAVRRKFDNCKTPYFKHTYTKPCGEVININVINPSYT